jgi:hypothetical protein
MNLPKPGRGFWFVLSLALALRLGLVWYYSSTLGRDAFLMGDSQSYWTLARQIANGETYEYGWEHARCFRMPGFPALLSLLYFLTPETPPLWIPRVLTAVLGTLSVGLTMILARLTVGQRAAIGAGIGAAIFPELLISNVLVLSESAFVPLMLGQLIFLLLTLRATSRKQQVQYGVFSGLLASLSILVRPSWSLAMPFLTLGVLLEGRSRVAINKQPASPASAQLKSRVLTTLLFMVAFVLPLTPWWIRNYHLYGHFVPTTLQTGASLYDGWNAQATGASDMSSIDRIRLDYLRAQTRIHLSPKRAQYWNSQLPLNARVPDYWDQLKLQVSPLWTEIQEASPSVPPFEYAFDKHLGKRATDWARENPAEAARLAWKKVLKVWSPFPSSNWSAYPRVRWTLGIALVMLALLASYGAWRGRTQWRDAWVLIFPTLYFTLLHAIFVGSIRYREPALYGLIIFAALGLASGCKRLSLGKVGG